MMSKIKVLKVCGKTVDRCFITYVDVDGKEVGERDDYVPDFFPEEHYGDYLELNIDVETGMILNWVKPTQAVIKKSIQVKL